MASERAIKASVDLWAECQSTSTSEEWDEAVVKVIDKALQATAEECAKIAESYLMEEGTPEGCDIAGLIRERFHPREETEGECE